MERRLTQDLLLPTSETCCLVTHHTCPRVPMDQYRASGTPNSPPIGMLVRSIYVISQPSPLRLPRKSIKYESKANKTVAVPSHFFAVSLKTNNMYVSTYHTILERHCKFKPEFRFPRVNAKIPALTQTLTNLIQTFVHACIHAHVRTYIQDTNLESERRRNLPETLRGSWHDAPPPMISQAAQ